MVLASSIYNIIYIYRVYVDSHSLGQLALASKRTASYLYFIFILLAGFIAHAYIYFCLQYSSHGGTGGCYDNIINISAL